MAISPAHEHILDNPPVFLPAHLEWLEAKAAVALHDFEQAPAGDTEALVRYGLVYKAIIDVRNLVAVRIEQQQGDR